MKRSIKVGPWADVPHETEALCWGEALREDACATGMRCKPVRFQELLRKLLEGVTR